MNSSRDMLSVMLRTLDTCMSAGGGWRGVEVSTTEPAQHSCHKYSSQRRLGGTRGQLPSTTPVCKSLSVVQWLHYRAPCSKPSSLGSAQRTVLSLPSSGEKREKPLPGGTPGIGAPPHPGNQWHSPGQVTWERGSLPTAPQPKDCAPSTGQNANASPGPR